MNRRVFLGAISCASVVISGCLSNSGREETDSSTNDGDEPSDEEFEPDFETTSKLGRGDPVSITAKTEREYEYHEDEDRVTVEDDDQTRSMSFEEWGTNQAVRAGRSHVRSLLDDEAVESGVEVGMGTVDFDEMSDVDADDSDFERSGEQVIHVNHYTSYSEDGDKIEEPEVEFSELVDLIPEKIEVTMLFDEEEYVAVLPILCGRHWEQVQ